MPDRIQITTNDASKEVVIGQPEPAETGQQQSQQGNKGKKEIANAN